jgi:hypothetical protein
LQGVWYVHQRGGHFGEEKGVEVACVLRFIHLFQMLTAWEMSSGQTLNPGYWRLVGGIDQDKRILIYSVWGQKGRAIVFNWVLLHYYDVRSGVVSSRQWQDGVSIDIEGVYKLVKIDRPPSK